MILNFRAQTNSLVFQDYLAIVDRSIASGNFDIALENLHVARANASGGSEILSMVKRAAIISRQSQDYSILEKYSEEALKKMAGNRDVIFLAGYAFLRLARPQAAHRVLGTTRQSEALANLGAEAALRMGEPALIPDREGNLMLYSNLLSSKDPALFEDLWERTGDQRLLVSAILLYMQQGHAKRALELGSGEPVDEKYSKMLAYIAYDAGDYAAAESNIKKHLLFTKTVPEDRRFFADLNLLAGNFDQAVLLYRNSISERPSATAYLNIAWIYEKGGLLGNAQSTLESAHAFFPDDERVVTSFARQLWSSGRADAAEKARAMLEQLLERNPENQSAALMLINMAWETLLPEQYLAKLWEVFGRNPLDAILCRHLVWYLMGFEDYSSVTIVLDRYMSAGGETTAAWYRHLAGLNRALTGDIQRSLQFLGDSLSMKEDSLVRLNRATLYFALGDREKAKHDLRVAAAGDAPAWLSSRVYAKLGAVLFDEGYAEAAQRELLYALDLDPDNGQAGVLLKRLEKSR